MTSYYILRNVRGADAPVLDERTVTRPVVSGSATKMRGVHAPHCRGLISNQTPCFLLRRFSIGGKIAMIFHVSLLVRFMGFLSRRKRAKMHGFSLNPDGG
jgi:hypothetical protein